MSGHDRGQARFLKRQAAPFAGLLYDRHRAGATIASVCVGAFLLGHGGLLDGYQATTHWYYAETFRSTFPATALVPEAILIADGEILTAAGYSDPPPSAAFSSA